MEKNGLVHIYCGDGKGKTTAAVGLCIRCAASGGRVLFAQFMKNGRSSERVLLEKIESITLTECYPECRFVWRMTDEEKARARSFYRALFDKITRSVSEYDMLVLDEIMSAVKYDFVNIDDLCDFLDNKPQALEVVMTGRNPDERLLERADYVSEIVKRKHPYDKGIAARKGIEY